MKILIRLYFLSVLLTAMGLTPITFEEYIKDADFIAHGKVKFDHTEIFTVSSNKAEEETELLKGLFDYHGHHSKYSRHEYEGGPFGGFYIIADKQLVEEYEEKGMGIWKLSWNSLFSSYEIQPAVVEIYPELKKYEETSKEH